MRTQEELEEKLKECEMKRDFWKKRMETASLSDHRAGLFDNYESDYRAWSERVRTLKYVLGHKKII